MHTSPLSPPFLISDSCHARETRRGGCGLHESAAMARGRNGSGVWVGEKEERSADQSRDAKAGGGWVGGWGNQDGGMQGA